MKRSVDDTMPVVTVAPSPNGLPIAIVFWPICTSFESLVNLEAGGITMLSDTRPAFGAQLGNIAGLPPEIREEAGLPDTGLAVLAVDPNGAAAAAGFEAPEFTQIQGLTVPIDPDIIIALDGMPLESADQLTETVTYDADFGDSVTLTVVRGGEEVEVEVNLLNFN